MAKRRHAGLVIERQEIATTRHKKILRPFLARSPAEGLETISVLHHTKNKSDFDIVVRGGVAFDRTLDYGKAGFGAISTSIQLSSNVQRIQTATLNGLLVGVGVEHAFTSHRTGRSSWNTTTSGMVRGNVNLICSEPASLSLPVTSVFSGGQSSVEEALVSACKGQRQA